MRGETVDGSQKRVLLHDFNPLPSCEGRRGAGAGQRDHQNFNPLPSREGRRDDRKSILDIINFNPLPSCEGRPHGRFKTIADNPFQSTPLTRGETRIKKHEHRDQCISIHSPHARGDDDGKSQRLASQISIHSPHARGDTCRASATLPALISIHSPHARGDAESSVEGSERDHFNPLPSCEGRLCRC